MSIRAIDATGQLYLAQVEQSQNQPVAANIEVPLSSVALVALIVLVIVILVFRFWRPAGSRSAQGVPPAEALQPSPLRRWWQNWITRWSNASKTGEAFNQTEVDNTVRDIKAQFPSLASESKLKTLLMSTIHKLEGLRMEITRRLPASVVPPVSLEDAVTKLLAEYRSMEVTSQTAAQQRDTAIAERVRYADSEQHYKVLYDEAVATNKNLSEENTRLSKDLSKANAAIARYAKKGEDPQVAGELKGTTETMDKFLAARPKGGRQDVQRGNAPNQGGGSDRNRREKSENGESQNEPA